MQPRGRSDVGVEGAVAAGEALAGAAGASVGFCSKMVLERVGGQGTRVPCHVLRWLCGIWEMTDGRASWCRCSLAGGKGHPSGCGAVWGRQGAWAQSSARSGPCGRPQLSFLGFPPLNHGWGWGTVLAAWGQPARGPGPQGGGRAQGAEC